MSGDTLVAAFVTARYQNWLRTALQGACEVVSATEPQLDDLVRLIDSTATSLVVVELDPGRMGRQASLIEGLVAARPAVAVIALGDDAEIELVLSAMRAGARDFITPASRTSELTGLIRRLATSRAPDAAETDGADGRRTGSTVTTIYGARPGTDTVTLALQLARSMPHRRQDPPEDVLLVDLGTPPGEVVDCLGTQPEFGFLDAVSNLRRLDQQMLDGAIPRQDGGLRVLPLMPEDDDLSKVSSAELYLLLGTLRRYYRRIVINLGGVPDSEFLHLILANTDRLIWLVEQSVSSCRQNLAVLRNLRQAEVLPAQSHLVVDRFDKRVPPRAEAIADNFGLPLAGVLPANEQPRLLLRNTGQALDRQNRRDPYHREVLRLNRQLADPRESSGLLARLKRRFAGG